MMPMDASRLSENYRSHIVLNERYRDADTQFEGVATAITFYRYDCERVRLVALVSHVPSEQWFDAASLAWVDKAKNTGFK